MFQIDLRQNSVASVIKQIDTHTLRLHKNESNEAFAKPQRFSRNNALEHPWCII